MLPDFFFMNLKVQKINKSPAKRHHQQWPNDIEQNIRRASTRVDVTMRNAATKEEPNEEPTRGGGRGGGICRGGYGRFQGFVGGNL